MRIIGTILLLLSLTACGTSFTQEARELETPWGGINAVGPDGRTGPYGMTAANSGDSSAFRPGTTVSTLMLYAADPVTKNEIVAPYVIAKTQGATVNTPFGQAVDGLTRLGAAALLGPIAAALTPDPSDNVQTSISADGSVGDISATGGSASANATAAARAQQSLYFKQYLKMQNKFFAQLGGKGGHQPCKEWGGKGGCS